MSIAVKAGDNGMKVSKVVTRRRMLWTLLSLAVLFAALVVRLAYVQLSKGEELSAKAEDSWRRNIPFTAKRGEIVDRQGVALAYNISSPTIYAIPVQVKEKEKTAQQLAPLLGMTEEKLVKLMSQKNASVRLQPGGRKITMELAAGIRDLQLPGIGRQFITGALQRDYTVVMGVVFSSSALFILFNLLADLVYGMLDPRARQA